MRAIQITELTGPATALKLVDIPEPDGVAGHSMTAYGAVFRKIRVVG